MDSREKQLEALLIEWLQHRFNEYGGPNPGYDPSFVGRTMQIIGPKCKVLLPLEDDE